MVANLTLSIIYGRSRSRCTFTNATAPPVLAAVSFMNASVCAHSFSSAADEGFPRDTTTLLISTRIVQYELYATHQGSLR